MLAAHPVMALIHKKGKSWSKLLFELTPNC
mgnify:CR=1 FL=1